MSIELNELNQKAMGGTELMQHRLHQFVDNDLLGNFQVIASRVRKLDPDKKKILWLHDLPGDPESAHLKDGGWSKFDLLVFVSHWQQQMYNVMLGVPYHAGVVLKNAIQPIEQHEKPKDVIRLIYFSTPHRGLEILVPVFEQLAKEHDNIELEVFSSFRLYGWAQRDEPYRHYIERCQQHPKITYHKSVPNDVIREALKRSHILAYPSIWQETSCLCLIEAMSAGLLCVHPSLAALPETASNLTMMYQFTEDRAKHANMFYANLKNSIMMFENFAHRKNIERNLNVSKQIADNIYGWETRKIEWENVLKSMLDK